VWAALLAYAWWRFVRARVLSRKLRADASNGWALRATAGEAAGNEVLAISGVTWTVQGAPAAWRVSRPGSR
jgi:membrane protein implicated in regulation of membrane protease activity